MTAGGGGDQGQDALLSSKAGGDREVTEQETHWLCRLQTERFLAPALSALLAETAGAR